MKTGAPENEQLDPERQNETCRCRSPSPLTPWMDTPSATELRVCLPQALDKLETSRPVRSVLLIFPLAFGFNLGLQSTVIEALRITEGWVLQTQGATHIKATS